MIASRYHDISCGHRVAGHPGKCANLHGHNYRIHFHCEGGVSSLGMVIDFGIIKATLCNWLELEWDHKMLIWDKDPVFGPLFRADVPGIYVVTFNPTAENMAEYLLTIVGPMVLPPDIKLVEVVGEETRKCSATARI